jgi:hypothetical protein
MAFNVSGLTTYVQENKDVILRDIVLGGEGGFTVEKLAKQLGVKTKERLHPMNVSTTLQEATGCGFSADGSTVISEREVETAQAKVNDEWCEEDMLGKFAEYQVDIQAGKEKLPFEAEIMGQIVRNINKEVEKQIWIGDKSNSGRTDLINGFVTIAQGADSASTITGTTASGASAYQAIKDTLALIPEEILDDAVIFVSPALFREYIQDLVAANLYHYDPANGAWEEMFIPGSGVKVRKTYGLKGTNYLYASTYENMIYACDLLNAKEELKVWFSDDNDVTRMKVRFNFGVQTLFPDAVVLVTKA